MRVVKIAGLVARGMLDDAHAASSTDPTRLVKDAVVVHNFVGALS